MIKAQTAFENFDKLDIRVGTVLSAQTAGTKKPTYRMQIDFGPEIGTKVSCGAYTNYRPEELVGRQVIAVVNFGPKKMGPETSEALVLGVPNPGSSGTLFLTPSASANNGDSVF